MTGSHGRAGLWSARRSGRGSTPSLCPPWPLALAILVTGCTSFTTVRSAEVRPGGRLDASLTLATPPGDAAAWFWAWDCPYRCNRALLSPGLALNHGVRPEAGGLPYELGVGMSGTYPFLQGYVQLESRDRTSSSHQVTSEGTVFLLVGATLTLWRRAAAQGN